MIKLNLTSGATAYTNDDPDNLRILMNSANNGRTVAYDCYAEQTFETKLVLNLINLESFTIV